jgi:hypothetical protein
MISRKQIVRSLDANRRTVNLADRSSASSVAFGRRTMIVDTLTEPSCEHSRSSGDSLGADQEPFLRLARSRASRVPCRSEG